MPVRIPCPACKGPCLVADQYLGTRVHCPHCRQPFVATPAEPSAPPPRLEIGDATSVGRVRKRNEDSFLVQHLIWSGADGLQEIALLVLADGMGGYEAGHLASRLTVQTIAATLAPILTGAPTGQFKESSPEVLVENIDYALLEANRAVHRKAQADPACKGMGATAEVVLIWGGRALIGHVGDCRVYHQRGDRLTQRTKDQTLVARMVELGTLTAKEARSHPSRNEVSQAVGKHPDLSPSRYEIALTAGDWLIAASDGLHAHLDEADLQAEFARPAPSGAEQARRLAAAADERGGSDNCTVLCVRCW